MELRGREVPGPWPVPPVRTPLEIEASFDSDVQGPLGTEELATTVSNLVDSLATTFSGDFIDSLTDFERQVTSWEHDAKETLSDLIKFGVVIKGFGDTGGFRDHLLINAAGTTEWSKLLKQIENVELTRRNRQPVPMDLSAMGSEDQQFEGNCSWCGIYVTDV